MSDELIELGLGRMDRAAGDGKPSTLVLVSDGLLSLLSDMVIEAEELDSADFRAKIEVCRNRVGSGDLDEDIVRTFIDDCESYFRRARSYLSDRETEFAKVIEVLRNAFIHLSGKSESFNDRLFVTSDRLKKVSELDDIRELKKIITLEVRELRRIVLEKQEEDKRSQSHLSEKVQELRSKLKLAQHEAVTDYLTNIANRAAFDRVIRQWLEQGKPFVLAILDLDHFKTVNDTYGHRIGDKVILCAAHWISETIRPTDMLARFGGDEFAVLLQGASLKTSEDKFTRVLADIANRSYVFSKNAQKQEVRFTMSCGLTESASGDTPDDMIHRADEALYTAKKERNRVCVQRKTLLGGLFRA